jgi:TetR/AcrR family transcriptional repressor of nem operon
MSTLPGKKQLTHDRIVETAARAIRRAGFAGIGVADIMKEAGLTHGGFYAHFASRDALLCEALERAGKDSAARVAKASSVRQARGASAFRAFVENYLSEAHLSSPEHGCPVAALVSEMPRQAPDVSEAAAERVRAFVRSVHAALPHDGAAQTSAARELAGVIAAQLVGALQMARAFGDNAAGKALLRATRSALLEQHDRAASH